MNDLRLLLNSKNLTESNEPEIEALAAEIADSVLGGGAPDGAVGGAVTAAFTFTQLKTCQSVE